MSQAKVIRIVSRGSLLARWQADYVAGLLKSFGLTTEITYLTTTGDRVQNRFLHEIGGKGLFTKELEEYLLEGKADLAVHSLKDMPAHVQTPFRIASYLKRHSPRDLFIYNPRFLASSTPRGFQDPALSQADIASWGPCEVATGSLRRREILKLANPAIQSIAIRGNIDTRLKKLEESPWKGLILAEASLDRLDLKAAWPCQALDDRWFVPAPAQGILAIECLEEKFVQDSSFSKLMHRLNCPLTQRAAEIERGILAALGGDCTLPYACFLSADKTSGKEQLHLLLFNEKHGCFELQDSISPTLPVKQVIADLTKNLLAIDKERCIEKMLTNAAVPRN